MCAFNKTMFLSKEKSVMASHFLCIQSPTCRLDSSIIDMDLSICFNFPSITRTFCGPPSWLAVIFTRILWKFLHQLFNVLLVYECQHHLHYASLYKCLLNSMSVWCVSPLFAFILLPCRIQEAKPRFLTFVDYRGGWTRALGILPSLMSARDAKCWNIYETRPTTLNFLDQYMRDDSISIKLTKADTWH